MPESLTEEKTEQDVDTQPGTRHIFCGFCNPQITHPGPGVAEACCGDVAPYEGTIWNGPRVNECEACLKWTGRWGCPRCPNL